MVQVYLIARPIEIAGQMLTINELKNKISIYNMFLKDYFS